MGFEIIKEFNSSTRLVDVGGYLRIFKEIMPVDVDIYQQMTNIRHENLAAVYGVYTKDGRYYAVCEYVSGMSIQEYVENGGTFSNFYVKKIITSICDGLEVLHKINIVHRDISAKNVIVDKNTVKIIDYDISRMYKKDKNRDTEILGTQGYAAPEQFGFSQTSPRSDIYSVGVLMNYMLVGKMPFEETASGEFSSIIQKCIQPDENNRYKSASQLKNAVNKKRLRYFLSTVPGFRSNKLYKKIIACIYYVFLLIAYTVFVDYTDKNDIIQTYTINAFALVIPAMSLFNAFNWSDRLLKYTNKQNRLAVRILITVLSLVIAFILPSYFMK